MNPTTNVHVVAVPRLICHRRYRFTAAFVARATIPDLGVTEALIDPLVAPDSAAKLTFVFVDASSKDRVTVPSLDNRW